MSKNKEEKATAKAVLGYLEASNRPFSANDVFNNLNDKSHGKTAVARALDQLAAEGDKVKEKVYGKQKVYYMDQSNYSALGQDEIKKMDSEIASLAQTLKELQDKNKSKESLLSSIKSSLSVAEIKAKREETGKEVDQLEARLKVIRKTMDNIDPKENETVKKDHSRAVTEWKRRKRMANTMLDAILEGCPKPKKALFEEIGIDTDEEAKVSVP